MAHGVLCCTSRVVPHFSRNMVDCRFKIGFQSTDDWKSSFYALPPRVLILPIAVYCCIFGLDAVQCEDTPHFTNPKVMKIRLVGQKQTAFPPPSDRNHSPMLVDCCIVCFHALDASGSEASPSEPPRIGTSRYVKK